MTQRKTVAPMFTATRLSAMGELIRQRAGAILDGLPRGEDFNWVREVSVELTGQMLATLVRRAARRSAQVDPLV